MTGSHSDIGLSGGAFCGFVLLNGALFCLAPQIPTGDVFGDKTPEGSEAFTISCVFAQGVGTFQLMLMLTQCPGPRGTIMAVLACIACMAKHTIVDGSGPPDEGKYMGIAVRPLFTAVPNRILLFNFVTACGGSCGGCRARTVRTGL
jgi:hypothetical protein